jgi:hypothetical protein
MDELAVAMASALLMIDPAVEEPAKAGATGVSTTRLTATTNRDCTA